MFIGSADTAASVRIAGRAPGYARTTVRHLALASVIAAVAAAVAALAPAAPPGGPTIARAADGAPQTAGLVVIAPTARVRGGFRSRRSSRGFGSRRSARRGARSPNRRGTGGRILRGVLQALGIAFLINALFGWGAGGTPWGLLLLGAIILWLVFRLRRRATPVAAP
jgi:hypothetical protein